MQERGGLRAGIVAYHERAEQMASARSASFCRIWSPTVGAAPRRALSPGAGDRWSSIIESTRTRTGRHVATARITRGYPTGVKISDAAMRVISLQGDDPHDEWNYF
jgi:hypothetical protein